LNISEFAFEQVPVRVSPPELMAANEAIERASSVLRSVGVEPKQMAIWLLRQYGRFDGEHIDIYQDACRIIEERSAAVASAIDLPSPASEETNEETSEETGERETFIPRELGQLLAERYSQIVHPPSSQKVNDALARLKLQVIDVNNGKKSWRLTKQGQEYGRVVSVTDMKGRKRFQICWLPSVLELLLPCFEVGRATGNN
jgi:hypothetical protein